MSVKYLEFIIEKLYTAKEKKTLCDVKLVYDSNELWAHSLLLQSVSLLIQDRLNTSSEPVIEISISSKDNFCCFDCIQKFLNSIYGQKVPNVAADHEFHIENLIKFFKILNFVQNYIHDMTISKKSNRNEKLLKTMKNKILCKSQSKNKMKSKVSTKPTSSKMQVCVECFYQCYRPVDMLAHLLSTMHGNNICSLCSFRAESTEHFIVHLRKHDNEKPFFCNSCEMRFTTRALYHQHLPTHSTHAPFVCPHCSKAFKWKHGLNGHLITHTKDKKHLCDECGFSTTHAKTLRAHKLTHSGDMFRCSHLGCSHTSSRKENMKIHQMTHSKKEPFVCEICGQNFTQNKNLQRHSLIHATEVKKKYSCMHCSFKSMRPDNVKAHMQRQHTEKPLTLDLCESFIDTLSIPGELEVTVRSENDLTVLADAASSRSHVSDSDVSIVMTEPVSLRNFDNLIANPFVSEVYIIDNKSDVT